MLILLEQLNLLFSGFHGNHHPNTQPSHGTADNVPNQHDEADFDIPNIPSVLETFMSNECSTVHCVPSVLGWAATIVVTKTFLSTWFSSAPLRNFA